MIPFMSTAVYREVAYGLTGSRLPPPHEGNGYEIAAYLKQHLKPEDTVQPLGWREATLQAMLLTGTKVATPFNYDFMLYENPEHPYIRKLRDRFITKLKEVRPRFIIEGQQSAIGPAKSSLSAWPSLRDFIERWYVVDKQGTGYTIFKRRNRVETNGAWKGRNFDLREGR
jgi:hypothetical protein